jgi:hypothetical protein
MPCLPLFDDANPDGMLRPRTLSAAQQNKPSLTPYCFKQKTRLPGALRWKKPGFLPFAKTKPGGSDHRRL